MTSRSHRKANAAGTAAGLLAEVRTRPARPRPAAVYADLGATHYYGDGCPAGHPCLVCAKAIHIMLANGVCIPCRQIVPFNPDAKVCE